MDKLTASWRRGFAAAKAARLCSNGDRPGEKLGAALFTGSIQLAVGFNVYEKTHPAATRLRASIHAEHMCVIRRQYREDKNLTIYVYRETHIKGKAIPSISKPCESCMNILQIAGISKIRFINASGQAEEIKL